MKRARDIEATITFVPTIARPRRTGYRPQFFYDGHDWDAEHEYPDVDEVQPGETVRAYLRFLSPENHIGKVVVGLEFTIREGARIVGTGVVTKILDLAESASRMPFPLGRP